MVIKRDKQREELDISKILQSLHSANSNVADGYKATLEEIKEVALKVVDSIENNEDITTQKIQDKIEHELIKSNLSYLAKSYIIGCYDKLKEYHQQDLDDSILSLIDCTNEEVGSENSNKNPTLLNVQRDYMAGEVSKDISMRLLLPRDVVEAHQKGLIHFHDADYYAQKMTNCCLLNLEDCLQNGTVINGVKIYKPKSFLVATTVAAQLFAMVASAQFGLLDCQIKMM